MTLKVNQENMPATYRFGLKILFDGYLIARILNSFKSLIINIFLFDGYLIKVTYGVRNYRKPKSQVFRSNNLTFLKYKVVALLNVAF